MSLSKLEGEILEFIAQHPGCSLLTVKNGIKNFTRPAIIRAIQELRTAGYLNEIERPVFRVSVNGEAALGRQES